MRRWRSLLITLLRQLAGGAGDGHGYSGRRLRHEGRSNHPGCDDNLDRLVYCAFLGAAVVRYKLNGYDPCQGLQNFGRDRRINGHYDYSNA